MLLWVLGAGRDVLILALIIPLSLLLGLAGLYATGQSLNLMTLGAPGQHEHKHAQQVEHVQSGSLARACAGRHK